MPVKLAVSHDILGEVAEESLHEVHPRTGCRGEMQFHAVDAVRLAVALVVPLDPGTSPWRCLWVA